VRRTRRRGSPGARPLRLGAGERDTEAVYAEVLAGAAAAERPWRCCDEPSHPLRPRARRRAAPCP
jgi:hypothetical protein